ncbi:MAG: OmpA family protein [Chlamydiia bacterium]|nr:OmpA family protein [Chlamydiia bacterium]
MNRGLRTLGGKQGESRAVRSHDDFLPTDDAQYYGQRNRSSDFVPLADGGQEEEIAMAEFVAPQPHESPGDEGSTIPGIQAFKDPSTVSNLRDIFRHIQFPFNSNLIKGDDNLATVRNVAQYMKSHPKTYLFVEGHCDERGPEAYNLALGTRRANAVRNALVQEGVNPDHLFTISYGKERPYDFGHNESAWAKNRRGEFKIHQK